MQKLILQIRRGGELLGSWPLSSLPLELGLVDVVTGAEVATFTAVAPPARGDSDEEATLIRSAAGLVRQAGDDLTMPFPEPTFEATPATEEASVAMRQLIAPLEMAPQEETTAGVDLLTIERARQPDDDFTMPAPEPVGRVGAAEVWKRWNLSWAAAGRLQPGDQVTAFGGRIRLSHDGSLLVKSGPKLSGTATLPTGDSSEIPPGRRLYILPPGSSVMLRWEESGIYVRSEPLEDEVAAV
jgi:hypothetical protein